MLGALAANSLGYWLGRLGHTQWHRRLGWYRSRHLQKRVDKLFARFGVMALFVGRFMWLIPPHGSHGCGCRRYQAVRFYIIDLSAALLWLSLYFGGGHGLVLIWHQLDAGHRFFHRL